MCKHTFVLVACSFVDTTVLLFSKYVHTYVVGWENVIQEKGNFKVTIIYRYIFSRFWDPKHFTGIKFCDFHTTMQTSASPCTCAQWISRKLPKKIFTVSTVDQLIATATNLSLSFLCGLREYHEYRTMTLHEVLPTVHERWSICHSNKKRPPSKRDVKGYTVDADREYEPEARQEHGTELIVVQYSVNHIQDFSIMWFMFEGTKFSVFVLNRKNFKYLVPARNSHLKVIII